MCERERGSGSSLPTRQCLTLGQSKLLGTDEKQAQAYLSLTSLGCNFDANKTFFLIIAMVEGWNMGTRCKESAKGAGTRQRSMDPPAGKQHTRRQYDWAVLAVTF